MKERVKIVVDIIKRILITILVILIIAILPTTYFSIRNINKSTATNQQVLEIWNIDTFEGGTGSKTYFLSSASIEFEKQNKGCYFMVKNMTIDECILAISQNQMPKMFSFGLRVGDKLKDYFLNIDKNYEINEQILNSSKIGKDLLAIGWCRNAYSIIAKNVDENINNVLLSTGSSKVLKNGKEKITYSLTFGEKVNNPIKAYTCMFGEIVNNKTGYDTANCNKTAYQAYCDFVENKANILIGTIRDISRVENRISQGKLENISYEHLGSYTDLVQYFALSKICNDNEIHLCQRFIDYVLSENCQMSLSKIGLLPVVDNLKLYNSGVMSGIEECSREIKFVENVF